MVKNKKSRRAFAAAAFAAAPVGAYAVPVVNLPAVACNANSQVSEINWGDGQHVDGNGTNVAVTLPAVQLKGRPTLVPFSCSPGFTKIAPTILGTATLDSGSEFSIDFGQLLQNVLFKGLNVNPEISAFDYTITVPTKVGVKGIQGNTTEYVTDFNLYLDESVFGGPVSNENFLGVQVVSDISALSPSNAFYFDGSDLIFDPPFSGPTTVNLLRTPQVPPSVPEPSSLALVAAGLFGALTALWRRYTRR